MSSKSRPLDDRPALPSIPIARETLHVGRRRVDTARVRVTTTTEVEPVVIDETLQSEQVTIRRTPIGQFVDEPPAPRYEGNALIIPVVEEVVIVERRLRVVEEVRIERQIGTRRHRETVPLRRQRVEVTRRPAGTGARRNPSKSSPSKEM